MKKSINIICILSVIMLFISSFFIQKTTAQEWTYDGVNTDKIPDFSVYPSEWYVFNLTVSSIPPENYTILELVKGNYSDPFNTGSNGSSVFGKLWMVNDTSQEKSLFLSEISFAWWNRSVGYQGFAMLIVPVEANGKVSEHILNNLSYVIEEGFSLFDYTFEYNATYPNKYSFAYWNETENNVYFYANFTDDGILKTVEHNLSPDFFPNGTVMSQPAQLPPEFSFTTENDTLTLNTTEFKLNFTIVDADNNNDGKIDTDYLFRIQNGTEWSNWTTVPNLLDWDLGDVEEGSFDIIAEVKNMYGVTQEKITINYVPPEEPSNEGIIPGYSLFLVLTLFTLITSILIRKKYKNH